MVCVHYSVFEPVLPVMTPAQPHHAAIDQMSLLTRRYQKFDTSHFQHNWIPINAFNKASNIDIKPDQSLHHAKTLARPNG